MTFALHVYGEVLDETFDPDTDAIGVIDLTDDAIEARFTKVLHGAGSMRLVLPRTHPSADLLRQDRYVIPETDAGKLDIGFLLSEAEVDLSSEDESGGEMLAWEGEGSGIVLERARMDDTSSIAGGQDPIQGFWDFSNQGDFAGASNGHPIPMMKRGLVEVNANSVDPIPMVDHSDWTYDEDSDGSTPPFWGEIVFGVDVGDDLYAIWQRMVELGGVTFRMHRDFTFTSHLAFGTDRQGAFVDAGAVRFEKGVNVTVALKRKIHANVRKSHMIVGGAEQSYLTVVNPTYSPGDVIRVGFLSVPETADETALEAAALANFLARERASDAYVLPMPAHGNAPGDGIYEPEVHFDVGDTPTFHTGSGVHDLNEEGLPIAAITWRTAPGEDYVYDIELGYDYHWTEGPGDAFGAGSQRRLLFCRVPTPGTDSVTTLYFSTNVAPMNPTADAGWDVGGSVNATRLKTTPDGTYGSSVTSTTNGGDSDGVNVCTWRGVYGPLTAAEASVIAAGGAVLSGQLRVKARHGVGVSEAAQDMIYQVGVRITEGETTTIRGTALALHTLTSSAGSTKWPATSIPRNRTVPAAAASGTLSAVAGTVAGDYLLFEIGSRNYTPAGETSGSGMSFTSNAGSDLPVDEVTSTALNAWLQLTMSGSGATPGDLPHDTVRQGDESVGTSSRATRCDHEHAHGLLSSDGLHYHDRADIEGEVDLGLGDLVDVDLTTPPTDGQALVWDDAESVWVAGPGGSITVQEEDGTPTGSFDTLKFPNGSVTDNGDGSASIDPGVGGSGDFTLIGEVTLGADAATMQVASIPATYRALLIIVRGRSALSASSDGMDLRVGNGSVDTGGNYTFVLTGAGAAALNTSDVSAGRMRGPLIPGATAAANYFGLSRWILYDYADDTHWREAEATGGHTDASGRRSCVSVGSWKNAADVIDVVQILTTGGSNLVAGSKMSVYGLNQ